MADLGDVRDDGCLNVVIHVCWWRGRISFATFFMKHPSVRFSKSSKKDIAAVSGFLRDASFDDGATLEEAVFSVAPQLRAPLSDWKQSRPLPLSVRQHIRHFHKQESEAIKRDMHSAKQAWQKLAPTFFRLTDEIFEALPWPKGKYIAYPTRWGMFPRYLDDKTFQIPVRFRRKKLIPVVIAHELLHFICYEHLFRTRPELKKQANQFLSWHVTELFNSVVQTTPRWHQAFGAVPLDYPMHVQALRKLRQKYTAVTAANRESLLDDLMKIAKPLAR